MRGLTPVQASTGAAEALRIYSAYLLAGSRSGGSRLGFVRRGKVDVRGLAAIILWGSCWWDRADDEVSRRELTLIKS